MRPRYIVAMTILSLSVLLAGCGRQLDEDDANATAAAGESAPEGYAGSPGGGQGTKAGVVTETMSTAGYTYVHVDTGEEMIWAAAPEFKVEVGDRVVVPTEMPMQGYVSKTLNRTFDMVYFSSAISVEGAGSSRPRRGPCPRVIPVSEHRSARGASSYRTGRLRDRPFGDLESRGRSHRGRHPRAEAGARG